MVAMVDKVLELHEQKAAGADVEREISDLDARIDALVYELYGLTDDEIAIVEKQ
ncbi:MAG: hypothetical protein U5L04_12390 [Trueperaceae bacterium]|nr:hypothetical protein [Trueperaceae bacterium]